MYISNFTLIFDNNTEHYRDHKVIYNSLSRKSHLLPMKYAEALINRDYDLLNNIKTFLMENKYAYNNCDEEKQYEQEVKDQYYEKTRAAGHQFYLLPTLMCNLRCTYCFQDDFGDDREKKVVSYAMIDKAVEIIQEQIFTESRHTGVPVVTLYGGEPFLITKEVKTVIKYIANKARMFGMPLGAVTNGIHISDFMKSFKGLRKSTFTITLDGTKEYNDKRKIDTEGNGTFDRIVNGIEQCFEDGFPVILKIIVDEENIEKIAEFSEYLDNKGWLDLEGDKFRIQLSENLNNTIKEIKEYKNKNITGKVKGSESHLNTLRKLKQIADSSKSFKKMFHPECYGIDDFYYYGKVAPPRFSPCSAGTIILVFGFDGKLYSCPHDSVSHEFAVGEYYPEYRIYDHKFDWWRNRSIDKNSVCTDCKYKYICAGGCASMLSGTNIYYCKPIKEIMQTGIDIYLPKVIERKMEKLNDS